MNKKTIKLIVLVLTAALLLAAVSCRRNNGGSDPAQQTSVPTEEPPEYANVAPLMWRVTDNAGHTLYLFGTIHVGDDRNKTALERVSGVLESCDALAVEFDVVAYEKNTEQMMNDLMQYVLTDGSVVSDYMPKELYDRAYELLREAGLMPSIYKQYNLAWWAQMVESAMLLVYSDLDPNKAMDSLLIKRANKSGLRILEVESSEFQMGLLNSFDNELYLILIEAGLAQAETYKTELNKMYELWLYGDKDAFWSYLESEDEDTGEVEFTEAQIAMIEDYNRRLLDDRNLGMRDKALQYLASGETVFFAVGAAHMANEGGLVQLLTDAGCTVETFAYGN